MNSVECIFQIEAELGEGPLWCPEREVLFWVDILKKQMHIFDPKRKTNETIQLTQAITAMVLKDDGKLLVALKKGIADFDPVTKELRLLCTVETDKPHHRFNDAKCDAYGRLWGGTMNEKNMEEASGALYCFEQGSKITCHQRGLCLSNGMGWSPDNTVFYLVESLRYAIFAYDFDLEKGTLSNKRLFACLDQDSGGCPDGMTVDAKGFVWSAQPGLARIVRYRPDGQIDEIIATPALRPSSCIFGGKHLDTLYIPSARELMSEKQLAQYPMSGSLFALKTGALGMPEPRFKTGD